MDKLLAFILGLSEDDVDKLVQALPRLYDIIKAEAERESNDKDD